jgi:hypothetical protein
MTDDEQHEVDDRHDSIVIDGDDADHVFPPQELDLFTPEPEAPAAARNVLWIALAIAVIIILVTVYAAVR